MLTDRQPTDVAAAMDELLRGYEEETLLYRRVRNLSWGQRVALRDGRDLNRFGDLLDEKQDLLRLIAEIEAHLRAAKSFVLAHKPPPCPNRAKLESLLDELTATIDDIRVLETANASSLRASFPACPAPARELAQAGA